jgi:hypothetical protein
VAWQLEALVGAAWILGKAVAVTRVDKNGIRILETHPPKKKLRNIESIKPGNGQQATKEQRQRAWKKIYAAVLSGRLRKPDWCEVCGAVGEVTAHHSNYFKPLRVVWLCRPCHDSVDCIDNKARCAPLPERQPAE